MIKKLIPLYIATLIMMGQGCSQEEKLYVGANLNKDFNTPSSVLLATGKNNLEKADAYAKLAESYNSSAWDLSAKYTIEGLEDLTMINQRIKDVKNGVQTATNTQLEKLIENGRVATNLIMDQKLDQVFNAYGIGSINIHYLDEKGDVKFLELTADTVKASAFDLVDRYVVLSLKIDGQEKISNKKINTYEDDIKLSYLLEN